MADIAALRTYLRDPIGLGMDATGIARANAIISEGINSIEDLVDLYDDTGIKTLCQNVQKPVGTIADPNWIEPVPNPAVLVEPRMPTPGQQVPAICELRLNLAAYGETVYVSINRDIDTVNLTRAWLR